jgi:hypothetical protein
MGVFMSEFFPEPITKLPEADIPLAGLKAHLSQSENHQVLFMLYQGRSVLHSCRSQTFGQDFCRLCGYHLL